MLLLLHWCLLGRTALNKLLKKRQKLSAKRHEALLAADLMLPQLEELPASVRTLAEALKQPVLPVDVSGCPQRPWLVASVFTAAAASHILSHRRLAAPILTKMHRHQN